MNYFETNYPEIREITKSKQPAIPIFYPKFVIYFLFNGDTLVYIGKSKNLVNRVMYHREDKTFTDLAIVETNENDYSLLECYYINKYKPQYNLILIGDQG